LSERVRYRGLEQLPETTRHPRLRNDISRGCRPLVTLSVSTDPEIHDPCPQQDAVISRKALLRCEIGGRAEPGRTVSARLGEFGERRDAPQGRSGVDAEFVVAVAQILKKAGHDPPPG
jgi:hypothetical protein